MGFDDTSKTRTDVQPAEAEQSLNLATVHADSRPQRRPDPLQLLQDGGKDQTRENARVRELPAGHPSVGAGTRHSDIIRDRHQDDIRLHLGPRIFRGDVTTPPPSKRVDVPTTATPAVAMENVGASKEFVDNMRSEVDHFPPGVRKLLADKGMTVMVTDAMVDGAPDLKGEHPRGWPPGTTFANEDGAFRPDQRLIMVAETFEEVNGKIVRSDRAGGVLRHETGHAVDAALDNYSQEKEFKAAYDKDVTTMPADVKKKLDYLLQADGAGEQECFAEVFAALNGGSANASQTALILQNFPTVADLLRKKLATL
jgi:hypothetical protein